MRVLSVGACWVSGTGVNLPAADGPARPASVTPVARRSPRERGELLPCSSPESPVTGVTHVIMVACRRSRDGPSPSRGSPRAPPLQPARRPCRHVRRHPARDPVVGQRRPGRPGRPQRPGGPDRRRDAGRLHRPRLRPVRRADPGRHGRVDQALPVPGRGDLHLRRLPRLPHPAQPLPHLGGDAGVARLAAPPDRARARRPPASTGSRATSDDFKIDPRSAGGYAAARAQGVVEADKNAADAAALGIGAGQHAVVRPRGLRPRQHRAAASRPCAFTSAWVTRIKELGYVAGVLLQRELRHQDARRRPPQAPRPVRPAGPHLDRPLGRRRQHLDQLHRRGRLAAGRPDEAVPGRPQRDLGRRHDQHRQQLPRAQRDPGPARPGPRARARAGSGARTGTGAGRRDPLRRHPGRLPGLLHAEAGSGQPQPAPGPCSACSRRRSGTSASWTASTTARPAAPPAPG